MRALLNNVKDLVLGIMTVLFFTVGIAWYGYLMCCDFCHPEVWDQDFQRDPRIYLPVMAVVFPLCGFCWWREVRKLRRLKMDLRKAAECREAAQSKNSSRI